MESWWARQNSNLRPLPCQCSAGLTFSDGLTENIDTCGERIPHTISPQGAVRPQPDQGGLGGLLYFGKAPGFADRLVYLPRLADKIARLEILVEPVSIPLAYDVDRLLWRRNESARHLQAKLSSRDWMGGLTEDVEMEARWIYGRADVVSRRLNASIEIGNCPADRILKAQKNGQRWLIVYPLYEDAEPVRFRFLFHGVVNARLGAAHAN